jgi:hypothetical protein
VIGTRLGDYPTSIRMGDMGREHLSASDATQDEIYWFLQSTWSPGNRTFSPTVSMGLISIFLISRSTCASSISWCWCVLCVVRIIVSNICWQSSCGNFHKNNLGQQRALYNESGAGGVAEEPEKRVNIRKSGFALVTIFCWCKYLVCFLEKTFYLRHMGRQKAATTLVKRLTLVTPVTCRVSMRSCRSHQAAKTYSVLRTLIVRGQVVGCPGKELERYSFNYYFNRSNRS